MRKIVANVPRIVAAAAMIVAVFAYNMLGLFEFNLPGRVANLAASAGNDGPPDPNKRPKLSSHFLTGAFATLLATPCSAPFVGTALGFALARGARSGCAIALNSAGTGPPRPDAPGDSGGVSGGPA